MCTRVVYRTCLREIVDNMVSERSIDTIRENIITLETHYIPGDISNYQVRHETAAVGNARHGRKDGEKNVSKKK